MWIWNTETKIGRYAANKALRMANAELKHQIEKAVGSKNSEEKVAWTWEELFADDDTEDNSIDITSIWDDHEEDPEPWSIHDVLNDPDYGEDNSIQWIPFGTDAFDSSDYEDPKPMWIWNTETKIGEDSKPSRIWNSEQIIGSTGFHQFVVLFAFIGAASIIFHAAKIVYKGLFTSNEEFQNLSNDVEC